MLLQQRLQPDARQLDRAQALLPHARAGGLCSASRSTPRPEELSVNDLVRPSSGRLLAGVCAALAPRFGTRPRVVRLLFLLSCRLPGPQVVAYVVLWALVRGGGSRRTR